MEFELLKKVNEPISFKGFKGVYLYYTLVIIVIASIISIVTFITSSDNITTGIIISIIWILVYFPLDKFKKFSKEDYHLRHKKGANKTVKLKGRIIDYTKLRNGR